MAAKLYISIYVLTYENVWHLEKIWLKSSNWWHITIGAGSALKSNIWQAIDWTSAEPVPLHIFVRPWLLLTHWGRDKLTAYFLPTIFIISNAFCWKKMQDFVLKLHFNLFPRVQSTRFRHCLDNDTAPTRRQVIIWTNDCEIIDAYLRHSTSMS